jgi:hypothetical protein
VLVCGNKSDLTLAFELFVFLLSIYACLLVFFVPFMILACKVIEGVTEFEGGGATSKPWQVVRVGS